MPGRMVTTGAEISFSDGVPIPPSVRPVIMVSGTDFEMGYQWFQQYAQIFGLWILDEMRKELTKEQIGYLEHFQAYIQDQTPEFVDIMRGMVKAANDLGVPLSYAEVIAEFCLSTPFADDLSGGKKYELPEECSGFAAWGSTTTDGKLVCLGIGDTLHNKFEHNVIVIPTDGDSNNFIASPYYKEKEGRRKGDVVKPSWMPLHPGMNNKGLAYPHHGKGVRGNEPQEYESYGIPESFSVMHTLRYADDSKEALEMMLAYAGFFQHGLWADTSGDAFVLECRDPRAVRRPGDCGEGDFIYSTNNVLSKDLEAFLPKKGAEYLPHAGWTISVNSISRNLQMWNMLHNYRGKVDLEFARMMSRFAGTPPAWPEEPRASYEANQGKGWDTMIGSLANEMVGIMLPDNGNEGLYYTCAPRSARVAYLHDPGTHFYAVAPTYSFYQLKLASEPEEVVEAARVRAQYDLYHANTELRKLTYWDPPYAPLDAVFNQAATEFVKAKHHWHLIQRSTGNERMGNLGKALRAFTRCQAYANHVYEALVPPPMDPSGLGLGEWFGPWGEWATREH